MRARNPLYIMAKPPPEVAEQFVALPRNDPSRGENYGITVTVHSYQQPK